MTEERCPRFSYGGSLRTMICHSKVLKIENCKMPYDCPIKQVLKEKGEQ